MKRLITLVDSKKAREGYEFIHYGISKKCQNCELYQVCIENLEKGRRYKIIGIRDYEHDCKIYGKVKVVEVEEAEVPTAIEKRKAFLGSKLRFSPLKCNDIFCENYNLCNPEGLKEGDICEIVDVGKKLWCKKGKNIVMVKLKRVKVKT